jgi:ribosome-associated protein
VAAELPEPIESVRTAVAAAEAHKAIELRVLDLEPVCDFTDYFLICSGSSSRQLRAIVDAIEEDLRATGIKPLHVEATPRGRWILMDYGDFLVHVLDEERRDYYRIEDIWSDAEDVSATFVSEGDAAAGT